MGGRTFTNRRWSENPLPVTRFRWRKVSENSATHNPAFAILARTTCISGFFPPVFPDLMKSHITEFHVCGHVAESTQHVAFRQHLPSLPSLEAESRLSGCNDSRLHVDRPASLVSPQSRPDQNRPSPVGLRFVTSPLQHAAFGMVKSCRTANRRVPPQRDAPPFLPSAAENTTSGEVSNLRFGRLFPAILRQPTLRPHQPLQGRCRNTPWHGLSSLGTTETPWQRRRPRIHPSITHSDNGMHRPVAFCQQIFTGHVHHQGVALALQSHAEAVVIRHGRTAHLAAAAAH